MKKRYKSLYKEGTTKWLENFIDLFPKSFQKHILQFRRDGIIILPEYFKGKTLDGIISFFKEQLEYKKGDTILNQTSFNGAVDKRASLKDSFSVSLAVADPLILALIAGKIGTPIQFANWRGYRLGSLDGINYRAWDWHNDQKGYEVKMMILLTDTPDIYLGGQPMYYCKGTDNKRWIMKYQRDSKYTLNDALRFGQGSITKCIGKKGTVILFNTNGIHRGNRGRIPRDILSFNFVSANKNEPVFPIKSINKEILLMNKKNCISHIFNKSPGKLSLKELKKIWLMSFPIDNVIKRLKKIKIIDNELDIISKKDIKQTKFILYKNKTYESIKKRFSKKDGTILDFVRSNYLSDINFDLNLPVHKGDRDIQRDMLIAFIRDKLPNRRDVKDLYNKIDKSNIISGFSVRKSIDLCKKYTKEIIRILELLIRKDLNGRSLEKNRLAQCYSLFKDLYKGFLKIDSVQRLRTQLIFFYFVMAVLISTKYLTRKEKDILKRYQKDIINIYITLVYEDDLSLYPYKKR